MNKLKFKDLAVSTLIIFCVNLFGQVLCWDQKLRPFPGREPSVSMCYFRNNYLTLVGTVVAWSVGCMELGWYMVLVHYCPRNFVLVRPDTSQVVWSLAPTSSVAPR